jgi:hypothetical protein
MVLVRSVIDQLRSKQVIIPPLSVIERLCAEATTRAERRLYRKLTSGLDEFQQTALDKVLGIRLNTKQSMLAWLQQAPGATNPRNIIEHIERLKAIRSIALPEELGRNIHQNHLLRLARRGAQTPANDFRDLTDERRYATLDAVLLETSATITDEILSTNDRLLGSFFAKAKRQFESAFQDAGRAINDKIRLYAKIGQALIEAKTSQLDPFADRGDALAAAGQDVDDDVGRMRPVAQRLGAGGLDGRQQPVLEGAPLRRAPGLRASTGT